MYLDFRDALERLGVETIRERYGNLFEMYRDATGEDPYTVPMRIAPGAHFAMGGLWSDYDLMTSVPGLFVGGEAGWAYHGANRLGANSLLSACVDGWFTLPYAVPNFLADHLHEPLLDADAPAVRDAVAGVQDRTRRLLEIRGTHSADHFHAELGEILYEGCGVSRTAAGLAEALRRIRALREQFWTDLRVPGTGEQLNQELERAGRVADFLDMGELMCRDALDREESCGAHFREEHQTPEGEALRDDDAWRFVSAWEHVPGDDDVHPGEPVRHIEPLDFTTVKLQTRDYR